MVDVLSGPFGVAVVAEKTWPAKKARDLLVVEWDETKAETRGTAELTAEYTALLEKSGIVARAAKAEEALVRTRSVTGPPAGTEGTAVRGAC